MKFEVFGPLLPLIELPDDAAVVDFVQRRDIPLALHAFSRDEQRLKRLFNATQSGSANGNDAALMIFANPRLPFGGAGASGVGNYHGKRTFDALSDERATTYSTSSSWLDHVVHRFVYPPYSEPFTQIAEWLIWSGL
jgi:aldehyde dehydrogenase (NAD+)